MKKNIETIEFENENITPSGNNHFEYHEFEEHADSLAPINDIGVFGVKVGTVRSLAGSLGNLFGGKKEDTSDVGFKKYMANQAGSLPYFPTLAEMMKAAANGFPDKNEPAAIQASYNPQTGTWKRGDWNFAVSALNPIAAKAFKGATEGGTITSNVNAAVPVQSSAQSVPQPQTMAVHTSDMPSGSAPAGTVQTGTPTNTGVSGTSPAGASLMSQVQSMLPSSGGASPSPLLIGGIVVAVIIVLILAFKK
jgi:cobalamin biosynthesis Mg chelatase CobN